MVAGATTRAAAISPRSRWQDLILPVAMMASILVILVPLPASLMDVLLSANITLAVIILLTTIYVRTPLEFSIFPSLLLATTLARLVLNVATTRLILTRADVHGLSAAGHVVRAFGEFVTGNQLVVGVVIFSIIVVIQFVVITKGATRIGEVAARFMLDGMPGRQMAIDADLNSGAIDDVEARRRRQEITRQADFFGAMDGASKFVRGDAIAGIFITLINIVGGLFIGVAQQGMSLDDALRVFTLLTIGDGLVTQVPAFLISVAAGMLVTRSTHETDLSGEMVRQLFSRPQALAVAGIFLAVLTLTNLPKIPLLLIGGSCLGMAYTLTQRQRREAGVAEAETLAAATKKPDVRVEDYLTVDPMEIEVGLGLVRLADPKRGGDLLERISRARQRIAAELGIVMPKVRVRDNARLESNQYRIKIADVPVADGMLEYGQMSGDPTGILADHLLATAGHHADALLTRDATKHLIDQLKQSQPALVDEVIPGQFKLAEVQRVLQMLLREQVSIRQLGAILEALSDAAATTRDPEQLTQYVRRRLAYTLKPREAAAA